MTTVDKINTNSSLLRPTDLSLKSCVGNRQENNNPYFNKYKVNTVRRTSGERENYAEARARISPPTYVESPMSQSPIALVFPTMAGNTCIDPAARLVVLDSIFSQCKQRALNSPTTPVFESNVSRKSRSRGSSDSSNEKISIDQNLAADFKVKTERTSPRDVITSRPSKSGNPQTPTTSPPSGKRGCKRKGGWKFHDLSDESDGLGRRKRAYCHNRLESEILQNFQDRVNIKEVPVNGTSKERIVIIEPSFVSDPDLVTSNTGLRLVLNKKQGSFQLQVLPFTIDQGPLSNKSLVLNTVGKMLGDSGEILCPGFAGAVLEPGNYSPKPRQQPEFSYEKDDLTRRLQSAMTSQPGQSDVVDATIDKYLGRWKCYKNSSPELPRNEISTSESKSITATDRLLLTLNKELAKHQQRATAHASTVDTTSRNSRCLMWHTPAPSGKGKRAFYPQEAKLCVHCITKLRQKNNQAQIGGRTLKK